MRRKNNDKATSKVLLILLSILCGVLILVSFLDSSITGSVRQVTGTLIAPIQKGINGLGSWVSGLTSNLSDAATLREENQALQDKVDTLTAEEQPAGTG